MVATTAAIVTPKTQSGRSAGEGVRQVSVHTHVDRSPALGDRRLIRTIW